MGTSFKERWRNHEADFKKSASKPCKLVKYVRDLKQKNVEYEIEWKVLSRAKQYSPVTNVCNLCVNEKFFILYHPELGTLNSRSELTTNCRHKIGKLIDKG